MLGFTLGVGADRAGSAPTSCRPCCIGATGRRRSGIGWAAAGGDLARLRRSSPSSPSAASMLAFLYLMHALVGYVELGTDSWITNITKQVLKSGTNALLRVHLDQRADVHPAVLRRADRPQDQPDRAAVRQRRARDARPVPARPAVRRLGLAVDGGGHHLRARQDVLLADAARRDLRAVPEGRGAGAGAQRRRRDDRRRASSAARASATSRTTSPSRSSKQTSEGQATYERYVATNDKGEPDKKGVPATSPTSSRTRSRRSPGIDNAKFKVFEDYAANLAKIDEAKRRARSRRESRHRHRGLKRTSTRSIGEKDGKEPPKVA